MTIKRKPLSPPTGRKQLAKPVNWLAPTQGFVSNKPLEALPPNAAAYMQNFFPEAGYVRPRGGTINWATGIDHSVQTIMPYYGITGASITDKMFAAAGADIYDVTSSGAVGSPVYTASTSAIYDWTPFVNAGGSWLIACNGADPVISYNGTTWASAAITGNTEPLFAVVNYQSRLYFLEKGTGQLWYMPTLGVTGALAGSLNVGSVFQYGGTPVDLGVWTVQSVSGPVLMLCIISSEGEVIVYTGADPTSSSSFSLVGKFKIGFPLGATKCFYPIGGDLAIMTVDGIVPISQAMTLDPSAIDQKAMTGPIAPTWLQVIQGIPTTDPRWQMEIYPSHRMLVVNVPDPVNGIYQLVMNTETLAWTRFVNMPANVWLAWEGGLYYGTEDGRIVQADTGSIDTVMVGTSTITAPIDCQMVGAWTPLGDGMSRKVTHLISVNAIVDNTCQLFAGASFDFNNQLPISQGGGTPASQAAIWDGSAIPQDEWDSGIYAGSVGTRFLAWAGGTGYVFAPTIRAFINGAAGVTSGLQIIGGTILAEQGQGI